MSNPQNLDLTEDRIFTLHTGLVYRNVCAPSSWTRERVEADVNAQSPTGIRSEWVVSEAIEREGDYNGCSCLACPDDPNRTHWLMNC